MAPSSRRHHRFSLITVFVVVVASFFFFFASSSAAAADASSPQHQHYAVHVGSWDRLWEIENDAKLLTLGGGEGDDGEADDGAAKTTTMMSTPLNTHGETFNGTHVRADLTRAQLEALRARGIDVVAAAPAVAPRDGDAQ